MALPRKYSDHGPEVLIPSEPEYHQSSRFNARQPCAEKEVWQPPIQQLILGLTPLAFWLTMVTIVLILAAGIGGGVGGGLAASKKLSSPVVNTSTASATASSPASPSPAEPAEPAASSLTATATGSSPSSSVPVYPIAPPSSDYYSGCAGSPRASQGDSDGTTFAPMDITNPGQYLTVKNVEQTFVILCNTDYPSGSTYGNSNLTDLQLITRNMTSIDQCIAACALYNVQLTQPNMATLCTGLAYLLYNASTSTGTRPLAGCWLKSGLMSSGNINYTVIGSYAASAILQDVNLFLYND